MFLFALSGVLHFLLLSQLLFRLQALTCSTGVGERLTSPLAERASDVCAQMSAAVMQTVGLLKPVKLCHDQNNIKDTASYTLNYNAVLNMWAKKLHVHLIWPRGWTSSGSTLSYVNMCAHRTVCQYNTTNQSTERSSEYDNVINVMNIINPSKTIRDVSGSVLVGVLLQENK